MGVKDCCQDLVSFFDGLDREYLIEQVRRFFPDGHIPNDYHHVLKNVLHYSYIHIEDILDLAGLPCTRKGIGHLNKRKSVMSHLNRFADAAMKGV